MSTDSGERPVGTHLRGADAEILQKGAHALRSKGPPVPREKL
ncbi:hypothetical protein [Nonomuraea diastatica]|nr:hypothetical protein [Nonomuraea diastatica]